MTSTAATSAAPAAAKQSSRASAPLPRLLRAELRWIFRRPRTLVVLGLLALIPVAVGIGVAVVGTPDPAGQTGAGAGEAQAGPGLLTAALGNAFVLPVATLVFALGMMLPLATAMVAGDALAGESAHGTLRGLLLAPVSRGRLLAVKMFGVAVFTLTAVATMSAAGVLTGLVLSGPDSLFTLSGSTLSLPVALARIALAIAWVTLQLWAVGAVALAISSTTEHPMLVLASVLTGTIVFSLLQLLDALSWLHPFLLNESWTSLPDVLRDPVPVTGLAEGALRAACYIVIGLSLAYARVTTKDG
jgi:ABC-2 type transport system permease protein